MGFLGFPGVSSGSFPSAAYEQDILRIAARFAPRMDVCAQDRDDYANELRLSAWLAWNRCPVEDYVYSAVWNRARDLWRAAKCRVSMVLVPADAESSFSFGRVEARLDLQKLRDHTPEIYDDLLRVAVEGSVPLAYPDQSRSSAYRRHAGNLTCARALLLGIEKVVLRMQESNLVATSDEQLRDQLPCFGIMWDPKDEQCSKTCAAYARCGLYFGQSTLPQWATEAGVVHSDHTKGSVTPNMEAFGPEHITTHDGIPDYAVMYGKLIYKDPAKVGLPVIQADGTLTPSGSWPHPMPFYDSDSLEGELLLGAMKQQDVSGEGVDETVQDELAKAYEVQATDVYLGVLEEKASVKKASVSKAPAKKASVKKASDSKASVKKASVKKASVKKAPAKKASVKKAPAKKASVKKASVKKAPAKKASVKKAPAKKGGTPVNPTKAPNQMWGPETFQRRLNRDLNKEAIRALPWGYTLEKEYNGETHRVQITQEGFVYKRQKYPTLYQVMLQIKEPTEYASQAEGGKSRKMGTMSAARFFGLKA